MGTMDTIAIFLLLFLLAVGAIVFFLRRQTVSKTVSKAFSPRAQEPRFTAEPSTTRRLEPVGDANPDMAETVEDDFIPGTGTNGLTAEKIDELTPNKVLKNKFPHIWRRICLFAPDPAHLQKYLLSLSIQDRGEARAGFPPEAMKEVFDIQAENDRFLMQHPVGWQTAALHR
jgi:hypothetical protein